MIQSAGGVKSKTEDRYHQKPRTVSAFVVVVGVLFRLYGPDRDWGHHPQESAREEPR
jgi:hypothetical protein